MGRPKGSINKPKVVEVIEEEIPLPAPKKVMSGMSTQYMDEVSSACDDLDAEFPFKIMCRNDINPCIKLPFKFGHYVRPADFGKHQRTFCFKTKANLTKFKEIVGIK